MKKIAVVMLALTCLLIACSSKTQQSQSSSSTREQQQATTVTTSTETSSSAEDTSQIEPVLDSQSQENPLTSSTSHTQLLTLPASQIPTDLIGKWQGQSQQARHVEMTVGSDGTITTYEDFREDDEDEDYLVRTHTARITDLVEYSPNHYLIRSAEGDYSALLPGITGLGGRITPGFILKDGQYQVIMWGNPAEPTVEAEYDLLSEPSVRVTLTKTE